MVPSLAGNTLWEPLDQNWEVWLGSFALISASYNTEVNADSRFREEGVDFKDRADLQLTGLVRPEHAGEGVGVDLE